MEGETRREGRREREDTLNAGGDRLKITHRNELLCDG